MADIFVSYKTEERDLAKRVVARLQKAGYFVWYDPKLTPDKPWNKLIEDELRAAKAVLVLWTPLSVKSESVTEEALWAKQAEKLISVKMKPCELPYGFGRHQTADLTKWNFSPDDPEWRKVLNSIEIIIIIKPDRNKVAGEHPSEKDNDFADRAGLANLNRSISGSPA